MKKNRTGWIRGLLTLVFCVSMASTGIGQVMYADFENHGVGVIVASPDWSRAPWHSKAAVETNHPYAGQKALAMHTNWYGYPEYALVHNFGYTNTSSKSPIIRMSTMLYMDQHDDPIKWGLGTGYTNLNLEIRTDPTTHHIIVGSVDSGDMLVTGRYARMTLHFDMTANRATMDYDGETITPWQYCGNSLTNKFNLMHFIRVTNLVPGQVLFDNVMVESFPADTWAWWRFEEGAGTVTRDHLAHYPIQCITNNYGATWVAKEQTWLFSGQDDLLDRSGLDAYAAEIVHPLTNSPMTTNWTIEAVMRCDPEYLMDTPTIVRMLDYQGNAVYRGAAIEYAMGIGFKPMITLRDSQEPDSTDYEHFSSRTAMPADGQWHHIAAVKEDAEVRFYLNGTMVTNYPLGSVADGGYQFETSSSLYLGRVVNTNEAVRAGQALSELRFTCRALEPGEFIQMVDAQIQQFEKQTGAYDWDMTLRGNPGMRYNTEVTRAVSNNCNWYSRETFSTTNVLTTVPITAPTDETINYRLIREIQQKHM